MESTPLNNVESLRYFTPELALIVAVLLLIIWDLVASDKKTKLTGLVVISMAALAFFIFFAPSGNGV